MKRLYLIIFALLLLTACGKQEPPLPVERIEPLPVETAPAVEEVPITVEDAAEQTVISSPEIVAYTAETLEGLVEDTVGYTFEIPTFDVEGADAIRTYYQELAEHLEGYTKETVYTQAAERGCIVSVYGYVASASVEGETLSVDYVFQCDFSDTDESTENLRTDSFNVVTGEKLTGG